MIESHWSLSHYGFCFLKINIIVIVGSTLRWPRLNDQ
jgi:hypothetical protein